MLRVSLPSGIELVIDEVSVDIAVSGEPAQLQQVVLNLCNNAAQAMPDGGSIRITAEEEGGRRHLPTSHGELAPGRYVCLCDRRQRTRLRRKRGATIVRALLHHPQAGTGLGLATVHEIVRDHDGAMNVQSRAGARKSFRGVAPRRGGRRCCRGRPRNAAARPWRDGAGRRERTAATAVRRGDAGGAGIRASGIRAVPPMRSRRAVRRPTGSTSSWSVTRHARPSIWPATLHAAAPLPPLLLATTSTMDVRVEAMTKAGISEVLRRPLISTELAAALARCLRARQRATASGHPVD